MLLKGPVLYAFIICNLQFSVLSLNVITLKYQPSDNEDVISNQNLACFVINNFNNEIKYVIFIIPHFPLNLLLSKGPVFYAFIWCNLQFSVVS
jgi:hypothetical protein